MLLGAQIEEAFDGHTGHTGSGEGKGLFGFGSPPSEATPHHRMENAKRGLRGAREMSGRDLWPEKKFVLRPGGRCLIVCIHYAGPKLWLGRSKSRWLLGLAPPRDAWL